MSLTPVLFSVSYSGSWGQANLSVEQFVDKAADLGYRGVLLGAKRPHLSPLDWSASDLSALRKRMEAHGFEKIIVGGYNNFTADLEHSEVPMREIQISHVTDLARLTAELGGDLVRVFTGYEHPAGGYLSQWNLIVDCLNECSARAAEYGVTVGVQNHHDIATDYRAQKDLIEAINEPNCKALFDAWAPALQGTDIVEAARVMAPLTVHTTIANYQHRPRFEYDAQVINYEAKLPYSQAVEIDDGFIDYRAFLGALVSGGFDGSVAYEMCSPILGGGSEQNLDRYARRFLEFLVSTGL